MGETRALQLRPAEAAAGATGSTGAEAAVPFSIEAEQQLIGAVLTNNEVYERVSTLVGPGHFYEPVHARIWELCGQRITGGFLASPVTIKAFLEDDAALKELGGPA